MQDAHLQSVLDDAQAVLPALHPRAAARRVPHHPGPLLLLLLPRTRHHLPHRQNHLPQS